MPETPDQETPDQEAPDQACFAPLLTEARRHAPQARAGVMFGAPALYIGRKMAGCVLAGEIGLKLPADSAAATIASGRAKIFTPYGRKKMREWIAIAPKDLAACDDLLAEALAYARRLQPDRAL